MSSQSSASPDPSTHVSAQTPKRLLQIVTNPCLASPRLVSVQFSSSSGPERTINRA
ncbi:hypothetical protein FVEG_07563 [Fusarium verticillioides 7600]|uniref:Uncharacterized protein n=1 Tax=Gibberella moniliformis (strain M3125 / FGSC 7600) TaxID=334819 RepID=W7M7D7_GIBM7|nr:hypothetical protein FVEG_07563 [Fusarium verticillioides 7600]EWG47478.1 hypothetical protein FVEG_07563 [Fusarium verticillioides 7600]